MPWESSLWGSAGITRYMGGVMERVRGSRGGSATILGPYIDRYRLPGGTHEEGRISPWVLTGHAQPTTDRLTRYNGLDGPADPFRVDRHKGLILPACIVYPELYRHRDVDG